MEIIRVKLYRGIYRSLEAQKTETIDLKRFKETVTALVICKLYIGKHLDINLITDNTNILIIFF